jgi:hypothetical protein
VNYDKQVQTANQTTAQDDADDLVRQETQRMHELEQKIRDKIVSEQQERARADDAKKKKDRQDATKSKGTVFAIDI